MSIEKDIVFIKLKDILEPLELVNGDIKEIIQEHTNFTIENFDDYIFVLDGLDELAMKTGLTLSNIDTICQRLARLGILCIVTTRHGYVNFDNLSDKNILIVELKELNKEQQINWLDKYLQTYPELKFRCEIIEKLHKHKTKNRHILELINQPILLHMIASMNISDISNLTKSGLYDKFFNILIYRNWEQTQHPLSDGINEEEYKIALKNMLKELAFNIFNSDYEYIHKIEFEKLPAVIFLQELLSTHSNNESLKINLKGVMISFYFKEIKKDEDDDNIKERSEKYAIEFLHKSLMEYMVSLYIYDTVFEEFLERKRKTGTYVIDDGKNALEIIWNLFYKKGISDEISTNLIDLIELNENQDEKNELSERLMNFFPYCLEKDFLFTFDISEKYPLSMSENTFSSFWLIISHLTNNNYMRFSNKLRQRLANKLSSVSKYINTSLKNQDLSELDISDFVISEDLDSINFKNTESYNLTVFNFLDIRKDYHRKTNLNEVRALHRANINKVEFENCSFNIDTVYDVLFDSCIFINVNFNVRFFNSNIFRNCEFENCNEIDFISLEESESAYFINCKVDGNELTK